MNRDCAELPFPLHSHIMYTVCVCVCAPGRNGERVAGVKSGNTQLLYLVRPETFADSFIERKLRKIEV